MENLLLMKYLKESSQSFRNSHIMPPNAMHFAGGIKKKNPTTKMTVQSLKQCHCHKSRTVSQPMNRACSKRRKGKATPKQPTTTHLQCECILVSGQRYIIDNGNIYTINVFAYFSSSQNPFSACPCQRLLRDIINYSSALHSFSNCAKAT